MKKLVFLVSIIFLSFFASAQVIILGEDNQRVIDLRNPIILGNGTGGGGGGGGNITVEVDPIWTANFTNLLNPCPTNNYAFGIFANGSFMCRLDINGTGTTIPNSTISDIINRSAWLLDGSNDPPTANWNMGNYSFIDLYQLVFFNTTGIPVNITPDGASLVFSALTNILNSDLIHLGRGTNTAVQLRFKTDGGNDGLITYHNGSSSSILRDHFEVSKPVYLDQDLNSSTNVTAKHFIGNGTYLTEVCLRNGANCPNLTGANFTETDPIFTANFTNMQNECPAGNYTYDIFPNGSLICRSDQIGLTSFTETDPRWTQNYTNMLNSCASGLYAFGIFTNGSFMCRAELDPVFSANFTNMQNDCPTGNYTFGIFSNGSLKCRTDTMGVDGGQNNASGYISIFSNNRTSASFSNSNMFRNATYPTKYSYVNSSQAYNIIYHEVSGNFTHINGGKYLVNLAFHGDVDGDDFSLSVRVGATTPFNKQFGFPQFSDSVCDNFYDVSPSFILDVPAGQNVSFHFENGLTTCVDSGGTVFFPSVTITQIA